MKIIFDFDHTLFSAKKLYLAWVKSFKEIGIKEELFQKVFNDSKGGGELFDKDKIFNSLIEDKPEISYELLEEKWVKSYNGSEEFLYADVLPFLERFKEEYDFYILSYGRDEIQRYKIKRVNIEHFFKEIYITRDIDKVSVLDKFLDEKEKVVFVDDNPEVLSKVKKKFPDVTTVRINRGEGKHKDWSDNPEVDFSIKSLEELEKMLLTEL